MVMSLAAWSFEAPLVRDLSNFTVISAPMFCVAIWMPPSYGTFVRLSGQTDLSGLPVYTPVNFRILASSISPTSRLHGQFYTISSYFTFPDVLYSVGNGRYTGSGRRV